MVCVMRTMSVEDGTPAGDHDAAFDQAPFALLIFVGDAAKSGMCSCAVWRTCAAAPIGAASSRIATAALTAVAAAIVFDLAFFTMTSQGV
jgi:hypothetical protein